jgi:hypothetical protein
MFEDWDPVRIQASLYLLHRGLDPLAVVECQSADCDRDVELAQAVAFPATFGNGGLQMAFFCSEECYLAAVPACACPRA